MFDLKYTKQIFIGVFCISILPLLLISIGFSFSSIDSSTGYISLHSVRDATFIELKGAFHHTILEIFSVCAAVFTAVLAFVHFGIKKDIVTPIIGITLFWSGCMDLFHTFAADRLIDSTAPNADLMPFSWAISRLFGVIVPFIGVLFVLSLDHDKIKSKSSWIIFSSVCVLGVVTYIIIYIQAVSPNLPKTIFPLSVIVRPWDMYPLLLYIFAASWLYPKFYNKIPSYFSISLWLSTIPAIALQLHMTFGSAELFDGHFNVAHFLKTVSYSVPFVGLLLDYVFTYKKDIEKRIELEHALHENDMLLSALDSAAIVAKTDPIGRITYVNDLFCAISKYPREELMGCDHRILNSGYHTKEFITDLWKTIKSGIVWNGEIRNKAKDGSYYWVNTSISPIYSADGKVKEFISIRFDITEQKELQLDLIKSEQKALQASVAKSEFLANMSHEIRTPMNGVLGMASLLEFSDLTEGQEEYVSIIKSSGTHLINLINDILDYSKIEAGSIELEKQPFAIESCVEEVLDLFKVEASKKELDLLYSIEKDVPMIIEGDPTRVRQILVNLVGNAVKFTKKGHINIYVTLEELVENIATIAIHVEDTGIGIREEKLDHIFGAFTQADSSTTREFGGTGLGLSISKKLAKLMDGTFSVNSEVNKGTTFTFTLKGNSLSSKRKLITAQLYNGMHTVLIDDNEVNLRILKGYVNELKMTSSAFLSVDDAIEYIKENKFDIVVTDMCMPSKNGADFGKLYKKLGFKQPLILISSIEIETKDPARKLFDKVLRKPIKHTVFIDTIREVLVGDNSLKKEIPKNVDVTSDLKILLVEDNGVNQAVAKQYLSKLGYRCDLAEDGIEVIDAVRKKPYDLILMDLQMPNMGGVEAARRIFEEQSNPPLIIAMTANVSVDDRKECEKVGMTDFLAKPVTIEQLNVVLKKYFPDSIPVN